MTREQYDDTWNERASVREFLKPLICDYPEMFPAAVAVGYQLHGHLPESQKLPGVRLKQIRTNDGVYTLRPSCAFSYMTGTVDELEKPLFLLALHVPIRAVTHVFGRNNMYWQRQLERMGSNSLAGTTVRVPEKMPQHIAAADRQHRRLESDSQRLHKTVSEDRSLLCFLYGFLENFRPFAPRSNTDRQHQSPAHRLNDRPYHPNWLHNLLASASLQGFHQRT